VPGCHIDDIDASLLDYPLGVLNLTVRASNCLGGASSINALWALNGAGLVKTRNFGRTSLLDVRRKLVHFCIDHLALPPGHPTVNSQQPNSQTGGSDQTPVKKPR